MCFSPLPAPALLFAIIWTRGLAGGGGAGGASPATFAHGFAGDAPAFLLLRRFRAEADIFFARDGDAVTAGRDFACDSVTSVCASLARLIQGRIGVVGLGASRRRRLRRLRKPIEEGFEARSRARAVLGESAREESDGESRVDIYQSE
jgi:hypothetical protein